MDFIYIIQLGDLFKIGRSTNPSRRCSNMQLPAKPQGTVYRVPDSRRLERQLHEHFRSKRVHGEWFRLSKDDRFEADLILAEQYLSICTQYPH